MSLFKNSAGAEVCEYRSSMIRYDYKPPPGGKSPADGRNNQIIEVQDLLRDPDVDESEPRVTQQQTQREPEVLSGGHYYDQIEQFEKFQQFMQWQAWQESDEPTGGLVTGETVAEVHDGGMAELPGDAARGLLSDLGDGDTGGTSPAVVIDPALDAELDDWGNMFRGEDKFGESVSEKFAEKVNECLRIRPVEDVVKRLSLETLLPANVPNLRAPELNSEVELALDKSQKHVDKLLCRVSGVLGKAMAPLIKVIDDVNLKKESLGKDNADGLRRSLKLLVSAFNYQSHNRKVNIQNAIKDVDLKQICNWESKVGDKQMFPFDVTKRLKEIRAAKNIGRVNKPFRGFRPFRGRFGGYGNYGRGFRRPFGRGSFLGRAARGRGRRP